MISCNRAVALKLILAAAKSHTSVHMYGAPSSGKTSLAAQLAAQLSMPLVVFRASQHMPEDAGGYPTPLDGVIVQLPLQTLHRVCAEPGVLLLDEYTTAAIAVRASMLQIVDERRIGSAKLHPDTIVILASNPEAQSVGGSAETLPERNRAIRFELRADLDTWCAWLLAEAEKRGGTWGVIARDVSLTIQHTPNLLQLDPPEGIEASNDGWASPRAWTLAVDALAAHVDLGGSIDDDVGRVILAGLVYEATAATYLAIRKLRASLPPVAEIVKSPDTAGLPIDIATSVAALGLLAEVGNIDAAAAWVYASRLQAEVKVAATQLCTTFPLDKVKSPHTTKANAVRLAMLAKLNATNKEK